MRLAQIAFNFAESLALVAALILPLTFFGVGAATGLVAVVTVPLTFAHRALAAAEILALAAALIVNFFLAGAGAAAELKLEPSTWPSSFSND